MAKRIFKPSRRRFLTACGAAFAAPFLLPRRARASQELFVRTPGGSYDEQRKATLWEPFERETGIKVVPVASSAAKLVAMFRAGRAGIDVIETGADILLLLEDLGALAPIDYAAFHYTNPDDLNARVRHKFYVGSTLYADVLGFNTNAYAPGTEPKSWTEFWNAKAYPGPRSLAAMASGSPNLEFALLADGVSPEKLYPLDIERAFKSMSRIRPAVVKFWTSGAVATQLLVDKEVFLSTIWSSRANAARLAGAPVSIQWHRNLVNLDAVAISKTSPSMAAAKTYLDYSLSPAAQSRVVKVSEDIPVNRRAYPAIAKVLIDPATGQPWTESQGIMKNSRWWADNRKRVSAYWAKWILR